MGRLVVEHNEEFPVETQNICSRLSLSVSLLSLAPCLGSLSPLSSPLALFLWPFDLSERIRSFKVLLFLLSGPSLPPLRFKAFRVVEAWVGQVVGAQVFYEVVVVGGCCVMLSVPVHERT